jgi:hypothetical protein
LKLNSSAALMMAIAAAYPVVAHAAPAARVDFTSGNVTAVSAGGQSRTLAKGGQVEQGDTINTNTGRVQLRFTDGAYVSLQPESQFRIDQYRYDGKQDGSEKGFFSLVKGGLRTITGLVGRSNKNNYQVTTSVATIGIRGTEYTIQYGQSITGTVGDGEIQVCNGAGCLDVTNGESYYVQSEGVKPVLTNKRTDLPPPPPQNPPPQFKESENVNDVGVSCIIASCGGTTARTINLANVSVITRYEDTGGEGFFNYWPSNVTETTAQLSGGGLSSYEWPGYSPAVTIINPVTAGDDGIIAWGTATSVSGGEFGAFGSGYVFGTTHWVAGDATTNMGSLSTMTGTYTLLGATAPTNVQTGAAGGSLNSMSMTANFMSSSVTGTMGWTLGGQALSANFSGSISGSALNAFGSTSFSCGSVNLRGFFAGANAVRAGVTYSVSDFGISGGDTFIGAAALKQTSLAPANP